MSDQELDQHRRRALLGALGTGIGAAGLTARSFPAAADVRQSPVPRSGVADTAATRLDHAMNLRIDAARKARRAAPDINRANDDELHFPRGEASFSKGLPHDDNGLPSPAAYQALQKAVHSGRPQDFDAIPVGNLQMPLLNPQGGLGYTTAGLDACQFCLPPAPAFSSDERGSEAVELYWMSVLRDVPFAEYGSHPLALSAARELEKLKDFKGPVSPQGITSAQLFRGNTPGEQLGPYLSQFLVQPVPMGALKLDHRISTFLPIAQGGHNYLTDFDSWLSIQNGDMAMEELRRDPVLRYMRSGRDLTAYVHSDYTYQAFYNASIWLGDKQARMNGGSPYPRNRSNQMGFATYGIADAQSMLAMAHLCAVRAVWYQKWIVHRSLRPEEFCARVHRHRRGLEPLPIAEGLLDSHGLAESFARTRGYLLPQAYPDGAPHHPAYAQGHATCAGACATVLKAFYDGSTRMLELGEVQEPTPDGLALNAYRGPDAGRLTVASELDKLAGNIAMGRNIAGIHWRSDAIEGLRLGEEVALALLRDVRPTYPERPTTITLSRFSGQSVSL